MWFYALLGAGFVGWTIVRAVLRIIEVAGNHDVRVFAHFTGTPAEAPIGPDGSAVTVELETAFLLPQELPVASVVALVLEPIVVVASVTVGVGSLLLLVWGVLHGRLFSRRHTALVAAATGAALFGLIMAPFLANMGANGAFAWISERTFDNAILTVDFVQWFGIAFLGSIVTTAFSVGDRLQRDTDLLV